MNFECISYFHEDHCGAFVVNFEHISLLFLVFLFFPCLFNVGFISQTLKNHSTAGEGEGHFINSSLKIPPVSQTLRHSRAITAKSSLLHIASIRTRTLVSVRKLLPTKPQNS